MMTIMSTIMENQVLNMGSSGLYQCGKYYLHQLQVKCILDYFGAKKLYTENIIIPSTEVMSKEE